MTKAKAKPAPAPVVEVTLEMGTLAQLMDGIDNGSQDAGEVCEELTRRIDKRAAAGKHPMVHVVAARDRLAGELEAA